MDDRELLRTLDQLGTPALLIVGDLILDRYVGGAVDRISPEAPIPVLTAKHEEMRLGGAGNVAANLRAMQAEVSVLGVVGDDGKGRMTTEMFEELGVDSSGICICERPTTEKMRLISGAQQILRVDWEEAKPLRDDEAERLLAGLDARLARVGAVILSDYGKGVLTDAVLTRVIAAARAAKVPVLVDPKGTDYSRYRGATLVTPNKKEAEEALKRKIEDLAELPQVADDLMEMGQLDAAIVTLGPDGIYFRTRAGEEGRAPTMARAVFDVTGAGDTVIAHIALGLAAGRSLTEAVYLANHAAGLVVGRRGAASVTRSELAAAIGEAARATGAILTPSELQTQLAGWRAEGKRIAFTNGCFDILHAGHVAYLRQARARGDVLIVGVNDDASVRRLKGESRPINPIGDRLAVLAALEMVDAVVPFPEDTPLRIIQEITPDVLVKGEDWADKGVVGREWVEQNGGEVYLAPLVEGRSTTRIVERSADASAANSAKT